MAFLRQSKFRHIYGKPYKRDQCYEGIRITKISWDSPYIAVNKKYFAVLCDAGRNSSFLVHEHSKVGRLNFGDLPLVTGHKGEVLDIAWDPFNDDVIASCSEDFSVKVWLIPEGGLEEHMDDPVVSLDAHDKRVGLIRWHPVAKNILLSAGNDHQIFLWNVGTGEALVQMDCHPDLIYSVSFNWLGDRIVTSCKDKHIRIINPRTGDVIQMGKGHDGAKASHVQYLKNGSIFSTGFSRRSERQYALWKESDLSNVMIEEIDNNNGSLFPIYDPDLDLLYLVGKGDSLIRYYEVTNSAPYVHYLELYQSTTPQRGFGYMPKRGCNVNNNEVMRIYKMLNTGLLEVIPFIVPRKSEQFQSDIYPDTRSNVPALTADQWFDEEKDSEPNMQPMSDLFKGEVKTATKVRVRPKSNLLDTKSNVLDTKSTTDSKPRPEPVKEEPRAEEKQEAKAPRLPASEPPASRAEPVEDSAPRAAPELSERAKAAQQLIRSAKREDTPEREPEKKEEPKPEAEGAQAAGESEAQSLQKLSEVVRMLKMIIKAHDRRIKTLEERLAQYENSAEDLEEDE